MKHGNINSLCSAIQQIYFVKRHSDSTHTYSETDTENDGILMGIICALLLVNLFFVSLWDMIYSEATTLGKLLMWSFTWH